MLPNGGIADPGDKEHAAPEGRPAVQDKPTDFEAPLVITTKIVLDPDPVGESVIPPEFDNENSQLGGGLAQSTVYASFTLVSPPSGDVWKPPTTYVVVPTVAAPPSALRVSIEGCVVHVFVEGR